MSDCIFCKIATGDMPAEKIYEDEHTLAFLDITPTIPGHTLVVPKGHTENMLTASAETVTQVMETVHAIAPLVKEAMGAEGVNINTNNGAASGQVVPHMHIHIIPRKKDDGLELWHGKEASKEELEQTARAIREKVSTIS